MKTYDLLICEDKKVVLLGLKKLTERFDLPIGQIYLAENGLQALELFREHPVDLVMTDIQMPGCDGLKMLGQMQQQGRKFQAVIISGYDDFAYAKTAIQLGIENYLLKPVDPDELKTSLIRCIEALDKQDSQQQILSGILLDQIQDVWGGTLSEETVQELLTTPDSFFQASPVGFLAFYLGDGSETRLAAKRRSISAFLSQHFERQVIFPAADRLLGAVVNLSDRKQAHFEAFQPVLESFLQSVCRETGEILYGAMAPAAGIVFQLREAILQTEGALFRRFGVGKQQLAFAWEDLPADAAQTDLQRCCSALSNALRMPDIASVERECHTLFRQVSHDPRLLALLPTCLRSVRSFADQSLDEPMDELLPVQISDGVTSLDQLEAAVRDSLMSLCRRRLKGQQVPQDAVAQAIAYMEKNYQKPLTLTILANVVSLNYTYFSSIFKKRTGVSVIIYLQHLRLNKAKELLITTDDKVGEIAHKTGFSDERYFGKLFKQCEGMTPSEYRQKLSRFTDTGEA